MVEDVAEAATLLRVICRPAGDMLTGSQYADRRAIGCRPVRLLTSSPKDLPA
jgi:hypothetical protein